MKKRRLDREKERAEQDEMLTMLQRDRGQAEAIELEKKEEVFHLEQAKARAKQRIREGRSALLANCRAHVSKPLCTSQQTMTSTSCHTIQLTMQCTCIQTLQQLRTPKISDLVTIIKAVKAWPSSLSRLKTDMLIIAASGVDLPWGQCSYQRLDFLQRW